MTLDEDTIPTFYYIAEKLKEYDLSYLHFSEPFTDVCDVPFAETEIGTLMINPNFDQEKGNKVIENGDAYLVAFGKPFISNSDLAERFEQNIELDAWNGVNRINFSF